LDSATFCDRISFTILGQREMCSTRPTMFPTGFDKQVPNPFPPKSNKKPRQAAWDDPNTIWPPVIPAPTRLSGKALLTQIENEELTRLRNLKLQQLPKFRAGDVVKLFHKVPLFTFNFGRKGK
jgi:hypothetical protein